MAPADDNLEYSITFPNSNFEYKTLPKNGEKDVIFVENKEVLPVVILFGWAGAIDRYLSVYSRIYEERGLITLRYISPVKNLFWNQNKIYKIGEQLVKLVYELNFEKHPIIIHSFSNGGAFQYQCFSDALYQDKQNTIQVKGIIFDSSPGKRRIYTLFKALSAIRGGNKFVNVPICAILTFFIAIHWTYEVVINFFFKRKIFQMNPWKNLKYEPFECPQHFIYSKGDSLIPHMDVESFAKYRQSRGIDVTLKCYENTQHVRHYPADKKGYIESCCFFVNKCLGTTKNVI